MADITLTVQDNRVVVRPFGPGAANALSDAAIAAAASATAAADSASADRVQTGLDVIATAADRVQTGLDVIAAAAAGADAAGVVVAAKADTNAGNVSSQAAAWRTAIDVPKSDTVVTRAGNGLDFADREDVTQNLIFLQSDPDAVPQGLRDYLRGLSLYPQTFGAVGDGVADDTIPLQKWAASTISQDKRFRGVFKITAEIAFNIGDQVEGDGAGTIIDGSTIASFSGSGGIVKTTGESSLVQIADLAANPVKGGITVTLTDASTLEVGDWFCLYNPTDNSWLPSPFPNVYREGEWCRVQSVDTGTDVVTLYDPLWRSYTAASMDVYRLRSGSPTFRNFTIKGPPLERACLFVDCAERPVIENVFTQGTEYAGIRVQRSMEPQINCDLFANPETGTLSNEYGVQLSAVNGGEIRGSYYAQRHGISFGGDDFVCAVPNRKTKVFADTASSVTLSLDVGGHGCSEGLVVIGGTHAGLSTGGANMRFIGSTFRIGPRASGSAKPCVAYSEGKGGDFIFDACVFELLTAATGSALVYLFIQAGNDEGPRFHFNNCLYKDAGGNSYALRCYIEGTTTNPEIYVNGGWVGMSVFSRMVQIQRTSGVSSLAAVAIRDVNGLASNATLIGNGSAGTLTITKQIATKGVTQSGVATVTLAAASSGTVAVTFPTPYAAAPVFVPSVQDAVGNWSVTYSSLTASSVTIKIIETGGTTRTGSVQVGWVAQPASQAAV